MKKILIYSLLNFLTLNIVLAQLKTSDNKISKAQFRVYSRNYSIMDSLFLIYQENQWSYSSGVPRQVMNTKLGHDLHIGFENNDPFRYGSLSIGESRHLLVDNIIEPNDSIVFHVLRNRVIIDGRGKEKYLLVQEIENELELLDFFRVDSLSKASQFSNKIASASTDEFNSETIKQGLINNLNYNQKKKKIVLAVLEKYKDQIAPNIFELLRLDYLSKFECDYLKSFNDGLNYIIFKGKENADSSFRVLETINPEKLSCIKNAIKNTVIHPLSKDFIEYLLQDVRTLKFNPKTKATYSSRIAVEYIINNYSGLLRDRLLTCFLIKNKIKSDQEAETISYALKHMNSENCIEILQKSLGSSSPGSVAFEFELTDTLGNVVRQSDFRGKIVLLDFFFTGCGSCKILNERMTPIVELFKDNPNIKFVSVNVDKERKEWLKSVRSLEYTHKGSVDLYTNGDATNSKIIQHYNVIGYPRLILIGKDGKIISANPPEPHDEKNKLELITMITRAL